MKIETISITTKCDFCNNTDEDNYVRKCDICNKDTCSKHHFYIHHTDSPRAIGVICIECLSKLGLEHKKARVNKAK